MSNILERDKKNKFSFSDYYEVDKDGKILRQVRRHDFKKSKITRPASSWSMHND